MPETIDIHSIIIIITFLSALVILSLFISKKKDFIKSHLKKSSLVDILSNSSIGVGNKVVVFELYNKKYVVVLSKNNTSNILPLSDFQKINEMKAQNE